MKKFFAVTLIVLMVFCCSPLCMAEQEIAVIDDIWEVIDNYSGGYDSTLKLFYDDNTQTLTASDDDYIIEFLKRYWGVSSVTDPTTFQKLTLERSVRHLVVEEGVIHISNSFNDMETLETVVLPESVADIRNSFNGCPNLKSIFFAGENEIIGKDCFTDCPSLQSVHVAEETYPRAWMDDHLTIKPTIYYEFNEKTATLTVSGKGEASGYMPREDAGGFEDAGFFRKIKEDHKVKHLVIKSGITEIYNAFNDMMALETVKLPHSLKYIHDSFQSCEKLKEISFPASVKRVSGYSFNDCLSLKKVSFNGPLDIGTHYQQRTFCNLPKLKTLFIHDGSTISGYSFCSCKRLRTVTLGGPNIEIADFAYEEHGAAFGNCPQLLPPNSIFAHPLFWIIVLTVVALFGAVIYVSIRKVCQDRIKRKTERNPEW